MNSHRRLPHFYPEDRWLFLTWHLHGSVPASALPPPRKASSGEVFVWIDRYLDTARTGPMSLRRDDIAEIVTASLFRGVELGHYHLGAFVLMANHVHVLLKPLVSANKLLKALKGSTAREANRLLGRTGEQFWQRESYDHWVRNEAEFRRIAQYIERNPVKAGLVHCVEDYRWSSANSEFSPGVHTSVNAARTSACATSSHTGTDTPRTSACATSA